MRRLIKPILFAVLATLAACGPSDDPPGPLTSHYPDMAIVRIPMDQRGDVIQAQQDFNVAQMEEANAEARVFDAQTKLNEAVNDAKTTHIGVDTAANNKKAAEATGDMNAVKQRDKELQTARDLDGAAQARVHYLEAYITYLNRFVRWTQEKKYQREAQYEVAKAQLGQRNNIAPQGVVYDVFPRQVAERQHRVETAKLKTEDLKHEAERQRTVWLKIQTAADSENGHPGMYWDPFAEAAEHQAPAPAPAPMAPPAPAPAPAPAPPPAPAPAPASADAPPPAAQ